ncbi:ARSD Arylsulfatase, partial [Smithornis capensis]|nr:ARSD Arylsulfatase [Smithornis capensis]
GKWHMGVNCKTRHDHCHHPLNHGFDYFYGMPFTLVNECQGTDDPELAKSLQDTYWFYTQMIILAVFTLVIGKLANFFPVKWKIIIYLAICGLIHFFSWFSSYGFTKYWNCILMRNHDITEQPMNLDKTTSNMLKEAVTFIERNKHRPFLLFVSLLHVHTPLITTKKFQGKSRYGLYGDNVEEMDWMVGKLLDVIDKENLKNTTFIYFASDHGGSLEAHRGNSQLGGWNGIYKGKILVVLMDIYPTVVHLAGGAVPQDRVIDGHNLLPLLQGTVQHSKHEFMFHYCGVFLHAVRWHQKDSGTVWKAHYATPVFQPEGSGACFRKGICPCFGDGVTHHDPPLLFNLSQDPSEANPLSADAEPLFDTVMRKIGKAVEEHIKTLTPVPQQLSPYNNIWMPWLQPCCGMFPFCWCQEENNKA